MGNVQIIPVGSAQALAIGNAVPVQKASLSDANTFTAPITVTNAPFAISITGTFVGTVTLQVAPVWRDIPQPAWIDVAQYTAAAAAISRPMVETWQVRAGFKTSDYTSGTAIIALNGGEPQRIPIRGTVATNSLPGG